MVKNNPYAALKFQYWIALCLIVVLCIFIAFTLLKLIVGYDGGSSIMTMVIRIVMFVVMVIIILKAWQTLTPLKNAMKHYEQNPSTKKSSSEKIDVVKEVDDILLNIEKNQKLKNDTKKQ